MLLEYLHNQTMEERVYSHYYSPKDFGPYNYSVNGSYSSYEIAWWTLNGDVCVLCPTLKLAEQMVMNMGSPNMTAPTTYVYEFKGARFEHSYRAPHASEMPFVFNWGEQYVGFYRIPWDQTLSDRMLKAWVNIGIGGNPNIS